MEQSTELLKNEINTRVIYVIMAPNTKLFFVGHCRSNQLKSVFQDHYYGNRYQTQAMCNSLKENNLHPCLFTLEELICSKEDAFRHVIAWTKIFFDAGYSNLNQGNVSVYIENMSEETLAIYNSKKELDISQLICCSNCRVANYAGRKCFLFAGEERYFVWEQTEERTIQVKSRVSAAEKTQIEKNAKACGLSLSAFLRLVAVDMIHFTIDDSYSQVRSEAIQQAAEAICQVTYSILNTDQFVPKDVEYIHDKAKEILRLQSILLIEQQERFDIIEKKISSIVQEAVEKRLKQREDFL